MSVTRFSLSFIYVEQDDIDTKLPETPNFTDFEYTQIIKTIFPDRLTKMYICNDEFIEVEIFERIDGIKVFKYIEDMLDMIWEEGDHYFKVDKVFISSHEVSIE